MRKRCLHLVFLISLVVLRLPYPPGVFAASLEEVDDFDQLDLEQLLNVVVSATRTEQKVEDAPAVVTVISAIEIERWGYTSVAEVLKHVVGFCVQDDHITPNAGLRGVFGGLRSESGLIKVMIDGQAVSMRLTGGHWLGAELVPLTAVERIEIIRGPASALYGADAFLGIINIITKQGGDLSGMRSNMHVGTTGTNLAGGQDMAFGLREGDWEVLLAGRLQHWNLSGIELPNSSPAPRLPTYSQSDPSAEGLEQLSAVGLLKLNWHLSERSKLGMTGYFSLLDRGAEFADWLQLANGLDGMGRRNENQVSILQGFIRADAQFALTDMLDLTFFGTYFRGEPTKRDRIEVGSDTHWVRREFRYQGGEMGLNLGWKLLESLSLTAGLDVLYDENDVPSNLHVLKLDVESLLAGDVREATSTRQGIQAFVNGGAYLQALWTPIERWLSLTGGLRYDNHNIYGSQFSGRAGAVTSPMDGLHLKLLYGNAFKAPSPLLLYGQPVRIGDIIGNPDLKPQYIHTFEFQVSYAPWDFLTLRTDLAYSILLNKAEFTQQGLNKVARNVAELGALSWESELDLHWKQWLRGYVNFAFQHLVRDLGEAGYVSELVGSGLSLYPAVLLHFGLRGRLPGLPLRAGLEGTIMGERRASDDNILEAGEAYNLDPIFLLDAHLALSDLEFWTGHKTTFMLVGRNLLGGTGSNPGYAGFDLPLAPRTILLHWIQEM